MSPLILLKELGLLKGNKTLLDVGTKDGFYASKFVDIGMEVDAIDVMDLEVVPTGVNYEKINVEEFLIKNNKTYDITVCRHVLHHLDHPKTIIEKLNAISKVFVFTCFGPKDDWAGQVSTLSHNEVLSMFKPETIRHHSEAFQYGNTYAGEEKFWHINTFVIKNG
ncbi:methyltransferase domain-containing protein [Candidatus Nomurabacteria bacterium]|nr:methyltransferase domain-containing protein [Candidatus Nomurabacteria bacterium]